MYKKITCWRVIVEKDLNWNKDSLCILDILVWIFIKIRFNIILKPLNFFNTKYEKLLYFIFIAIFSLFNEKK